MKIKILMLFFIFIYVVLYKTYLMFLGETFIYIINPVFWLIFSFSCHLLIRNKRFKDKDYSDISIRVVTIISLIYIIFYYAYGLISGYSNNPYATDINGIIINFFSILIPTCLKEYVRYLFMRIKVRHYRTIYLIFLFIIFLIPDINIMNILVFDNPLDLVIKELIMPIFLNMLMMYIIYLSDYKSAIISRIILLVPSFILSVVPDYEWFEIMIFNTLYCLCIYLVLQYVIGNKEKNIPTRLMNLPNLRRWAISGILLFILFAFGAGLLSVKPVVILTGSMRPQINPGDMVIIRKCSINDIKVGDIIEYKVNDYSIVHRVVEIYFVSGNSMLITKGDANKTIDKNPVAANQVIGKLEYNIPYIGYPVYFLQNIVNNNKEVDI